MFLVEHEDLALFLERATSISISSSRKDSGLGFRLREKTINTSTEAPTKPTTSKRRDTSLQKKRVVILRSISALFFSKSPLSGNSWRRKNRMEKPLHHATSRRRALTERKSRHSTFRNCVLFSLEESDSLNRRSRREKKGRRKH